MTARYSAIFVLTKGSNIFPIEQESGWQFTRWYFISFLNKNKLKTVRAYFPPFLTNVIYFIHFNFLNVTLRAYK